MLKVLRVRRGIIITRSVLPSCIT